MAIAVLTVDIVAKMADLQTGFDKAAQIAERNSKRIENALGGIRKVLIGGFGVVAIGDTLVQIVKDAVLAIPKAVQALDDLADTAPGLGLLATELSALQLSARTFGIAQEDINTALSKFSSVLADAKAGGEKSVSVVRALGIDLGALRAGTLSTNDALGQSADKLKKYADGFEKSNLLRDAFGRGGARFASFLNEGSEALTKFGGASAETIAHAQKLQDQIDKLAASSEKAKLAFAGLIATQINKLLDRDSVNADTEVLARLGKQIETLKKQLGGRLNEEVRQAIELDLADLEARAATLRQQVSSGRTREDRSAGAVLGRAPVISSGAKGEGESFLENLKRQVEKLEQGEFAALRLEAAQKKVATAAEPFIRLLEQAKSLQESIKLYVEDQARIERDAEGQQQFNRTLQDRVRQIQLETDLIGKSAAQQEKLNAAREIAAQLDQRLRTQGIGLDEIADALRRADEALADASRVIDEKMARAQSQALDELLQQIDDEITLTGKSNAERQRSVLLRGLEKAGIDEESDAYQKLLQKINKISEAIDFRDKVQDLQRTFDELGQAIASNIENAILQFKGLGAAIRSIEQDILRILTRRLVTDPIARGIGDIIRRGIGGIFGSGNASVDAQPPFAKGGFLQPGHWAIAGEAGAELLYGGRSGITVTPTSGKAGGMTVVQNFTVSSPASRETQSQIAAAAARGLAVAHARYN